jgi:hypothetical protein
MSKRLTCLAVEYTILGTFWEDCPAGNIVQLPPFAPSNERDLSYGSLTRPQKYGGVSSSTCSIVCLLLLKGYVFVADMSHTHAMHCARIWSEV